MQKSKAKIIRLKTLDTSPDGKKTLPRTAAKNTREARPAQRRSHLRSVPDPQAQQPEPIDAAPEPVFKRCTLHGPDGIQREAWELYVNGIMIGRAESKENLRTYYTRLSEPLSSAHWRDNLVRPRRGPIAKDRNKEHNADAEPASSDQENSEETLHATV